MLSDTLTALVIGAYLGAAGDHAALYQGQIEPSFVQTIWTTHPYWGDEEFHVGNICYDGNVYSSVPMRYNILENRLAVITPVGKLVVVPEQDRIAWFDVDGWHYVRANGCFMRAEYWGDHASLLHRKSKRYAGDVAVERHYYRNIQEADDYYLLLADGSLHEVHNLRSLAKAVPAYRDVLRQLRHDRNLSFRPASRGVSLEQCVELIDQQAAFAPSSLPITPSTLPITLSSPSNTSSPSVAPLDRVAAYQAYTPSGHTQLEYSGDDNVAETPGVGRLEALREARSLQEVEVLGMHTKLSQQLSGVESFRPSLLRNIPLAMGEADVLKLALKLPGVSSTGEAASGINVRGGATEQTLMQMNGHTIFNPMHMFGLFSAFNPDLVAETELYKGSIPSQYGGRLSSVMNITGKMPDRRDYHGSASIGLVTTRAMVELPVVKDRVSLLLGGRATYSDWMLKLIPEEEPKDDETFYYDYHSMGSSSQYPVSSVNRVGSYREGNANYWDLGGTLAIHLTEPSATTHAQTLLLNGYYSHDRFALTQDKKYAYANMNFSAEMRSHYGPRLSTTITTGYDHYDYANDDTELHYSAARLSFDLNQYFIKGIANYQLREDHQLNMGLQSQLYHIMPGCYQPLGSDSEVIGRQLDVDQALEGAVWMEDTWTLSPDISLTGGLRLNVFRSLSSSPSLSSTLYLNPDLRLSASYMLNENSSIKAGFNTLHQYIHKVSNTVIMSPADTWMLSNSSVKPQSGWQLSAGYYRQSANSEYEFTAEAYYKGMDHYLTYRNAAILVMNPELYRDVVGTHGRAYGVELQARKLYGRLNGWLSYTYARTQLRQRTSGAQLPINHGQWFSADYDSPHDVKLVCNFRFTRRYSTSLNADYSTGRPFTAPVGQVTSEDDKHLIPIYSQRNAFRMPDYFRLDWSFNIEPSHHLTALTHSWFTIGVYNLLGRKNAYSVYFQSERNQGVAQIRGHQLSIFGAPIPYINYNVRF